MVFKITFQFLYVHICIGDRHIIPEYKTEEKVV